MGPQMILLMIPLLQLEKPQAVSPDVQAVLEWNVAEPPPLSCETLERIVAAAAADSGLRPETRRALLLRRGIVRFFGTSAQLLGAARDFHECHTLAPDDPVAHAYFVAARAGAGLGPETGEKLLREAQNLVRRHPHNPLPRFALCAVLLERQQLDYKRLLTVLDECITLDPEFAAAYGGKVQIYVLLHDYDKCLDAIKLARRCPPGNFTRFAETIRFHEATVYLEQGHTSAALAILLDVVHMVPDLGSPRVQLWVCLSVLGRAASAEAVANELVEKFPRQGEAYVAKAVSLSLRGEHQAARDVAAEITELKIERIGYLRGWLAARLAEAAGEFPEAIVGFEQALVDLADTRVGTIYAVDGRFRLALLRAAGPDKKTRDGVKAVRLARTLVEELDESPASRMAWLVLACGHAEKGDFEDAIVAVDQAMKGADVPDEEAARCRKLKRLFESKTPYRMGAKGPADRLVEIPAVACYFGPLKKIDLDAEPALTIPDE